MEEIAIDQKGFSLDELLSLKRHPAFEKLQMYLFYNGSSHLPTTSIDEIAKKALVETGHQEVFRVVDALIANLESLSDKDLGPMPTTNFENLEYTGDSLEE